MPPKGVLWRGVLAQAIAYGPCVVTLAWPAQVLDQPMGHWTLRSALLLVCFLSGLFVAQYVTASRAVAGATSGAPVALGPTVRVHWAAWRAVLGLGLAGALLIFVVIAAADYAVVMLMPEASATLPMLLVLAGVVMLLYKYGQGVRACLLLPLFLSVRQHHVARAWHGAQSARHLAAWLATPVQVPKVVSVGAVLVWYLGSVAAMSQGLSLRNALVGGLLGWEVFLRSLAFCYCEVSDPPPPTR